MKKLFLDKIENIVEITSEEHKHLSKALRSKVNDKVFVSIGDGYDYCYRVDKIEKEKTFLRLIGKEKNKTEPKISLTLFSAILKGDKNELVVRAATELGATKIVPMLTAYTTQTSYNQARMQKIAKEAAKQSGRGIIPKVEKLADFAKMCNIVRENRLIVFPYEGNCDENVLNFLEKVDFSKIYSVAVIVGSEGGFSANEVEKLKEIGAVPITMGKRILRADTATAAILSLVFCFAGEMK